MALRVGIDAHVLGKGIGGVEVYVEELVKRLPALTPELEYYIFVNRAYAATHKAAGDNVHLVPLACAEPMVQRSLLLPWLAGKLRLDLLQVQRIAPFWGRCPVMLTVHDLVPLKEKRLYKGMRNMLVRTLTGPSVKRSAVVVCPSRTVCEEVRDFFHTSVPCLPFYNGVDRSFFFAEQTEEDEKVLAKLGLLRPYIHFSGAVEARKNLETLYRALARVEGVDLVQTGKIRDAGYADWLEELRDELGLADRIHHPGYLERSELRALIRRAKVFVSPSLDEGFDLPPLEAMACGVPVLCSDIAVHQELFAGAVEFFSPIDERQLARLLEKSVHGGGINGKNEAVERCVAHLSWEAMAERMAGYYRTFLAGDL